MSVQDFQVLGRIGEGSFSTVALVRRKGGDTQYALKIINKHLIVRNKMVEYIKSERSILDRLHHDGIAKLEFTFQDVDSLCKAASKERASTAACLTAHPCGWSAFCVAHWRKLFAW